MSECPYCAQALPPDFNKNELKKKRQRETMKALAKDGIDIGRPKKVSLSDDIFIRRLKDNYGMNSYQIARDMGVSRATVLRSLRRTRI